MLLNFQTLGCKLHSLLVVNESETWYSGGQYQLLDWLENCTFPMESKFANVDFARTKYRSVVRRIINCGVCGPILYRTTRLNIIILADNYLLLLWDPSPRTYEGPGRYNP